MLVGLVRAGASRRGKAFLPDVTTLEKKRLRFFPAAGQRGQRSKIPASFSDPMNLLSNVLSLSRSTSACIPCCARDTSRRRSHAGRQLIAEDIFFPFGTKSLRFQRLGFFAVKISTNPGRFSRIFTCHMRDSLSFCQSFLRVRAGFCELALRTRPTWHL